MTRLNVFVLLALGLSVSTFAEHASELDASCNARLNWDLDGPALTWGLTHLTKTAQQCCDECKRVAKCNSWTWCPENKCWSPDIWDHRLHECWLKIQDDPRNPKVNHEGAFSHEFRSEHTTAPEKTPWMSGIIFKTSF